jgi:nucleoporin NUP82
MPKILARDPAWVSAKIFTPTNDAKTQLVSEVEYDGPLRQVAHRGSEIFVAAGNELRWCDLALVKDATENLDRRSRRHGNSTEEGEGEKAYRVSFD